MNNSFSKLYRIIMEVCSKTAKVDPRVFLGGSILLTILSSFLACVDTNLPAELKDEGTDIEVIPCAEGIELEGVFVNLQLPVPAFNIAIVFSLSLPEDNDYMALKIRFGELKVDARIKMRKDMVIEAVQ